MFVAIIVCVVLTGEKDIPEFNETDKIIFTYFIINSCKVITFKQLSTI